MKARKYAEGGKTPPKSVEAEVKAQRRKEMYEKEQAATKEANKVAVAQGGKPAMRAKSGQATEEFRQKAKIAANLKIDKLEAAGAIKGPTPASTEEYHGKYAAIKPKAIKKVI